MFNKDPVQHSDADHLWERYYVAFGLSYIHLNCWYLDHLDIKSEKDFYTAMDKYPKEFGIMESQGYKFAQYLLIPENLISVDREKWGEIELARMYEVPVSIMKRRLGESR